MLIKYAFRERRFILLMGLSVLLINLSGPMRRVVFFGGEGGGGVIFVRQWRISRNWFSSNKMLIHIIIIVTLL